MQFLLSLSLSSFLASGNVRTHFAEIHVTFFIGSEYSDDVNLLEDKIDNIKEKQEALIDPSKEIGLEINV
jgi:hypothetical protein